MFFCSVYRWVETLNLVRGVFGADLNMVLGCYTYVLTCSPTDFEGLTSLVKQEPMLAMTTLVRRKDVFASFGAEGGKLWDDTVVAPKAGTRSEVVADSGVGGAVAGAAVATDAPGPSVPGQEGLGDDERFALRLQRAEYAEGSESSMEFGDD